MLTSKYDLDRPHDEILKRALPFLIFPPKEFRDALAEQLDSLCQYYRDKNDAAYPDKYKHISTMLDQARFDEHTDFKIFYFECDHRTVQESLRRIEERLFRLESGFKQKPKDNTVAIMKDTSISQKKEKALPTKEEDAKGHEGGAPMKEEGVKQIGPSQLVADCLKKSTRSLSTEEISHLVGLTEMQVSNAVKSKGGLRNGIKVEQVIVEKHIPYSDGKVITKKVHVNTYSWIGEK